MSGDQAFCDLVAREHRGLTAAAVMIVGSRTTAEEIVQDVLERTYERWGTVSTMDRPGAWVRRAVLNRSISVARRRASERRALDRLRRAPAAPEAESATVGDPGAEIWALVRTLPTHQATAVALHYGADLSIATVAEEMDLTVPAVKTLLHRARASLRQHRDIEEIRR